MIFNVNALRVARFVWILNFKSHVNDGQALSCTTTPRRYKMSSMIHHIVSGRGKDRTPAHDRFYPPGRPSVGVENHLSSMLSRNPALCRSGNVRRWFGGICNEEDQLSQPTSTPTRHDLRSPKLSGFFMFHGDGRRQETGLVW